MSFERPPTSPHERTPILTLEQWEKERFKQEYDSRAITLNMLGALDLTLEGKGVIGIDGRQYLYPKRAAILSWLYDHRSIIESKMKEGYTRLSVTPFASPLVRHIDILKKTILSTYRKNGGTLYSAPTDILRPEDPLEHLELDTDQPLYYWEEYDNADVDGNLVYFPQEFSPQHGGKTKQALLDIQRADYHPFPGFLVSLLHERVQIPREGQGVQGQIEAGKSPEEYLRLFRDAGNDTHNPFHGLRGQTPEEGITLMITILHENKGQVIDDCFGGGRGSLNLMLGGYFPGSVRVPYLDWYRDYRQARLGRHNSRSRDGVCGVRGAVGMN